MKEINIYFGYHDNVTRKGFCINRNIGLIEIDFRKQRGGHCVPPGARLAVS